MKRLYRKRMDKRPSPKLHTLASDLDRRVSDKFLDITSDIKLTSEWKYLKKVVLHDVSDDSKLVKVSSSPLGAKGLLEGDGDACDGVPVPRRTKDHVWETQRDQILDHLLAWVINISCFVLQDYLLWRWKIFCLGNGQSCRADPRWRVFGDALKGLQSCQNPGKHYKNQNWIKTSLLTQIMKVYLSEGFFHNDPCPAFGSHTSGLWTRKWLFGTAMNLNCFKHIAG